MSVFFPGWFAFSVVRTHRLIPLYFFNPLVFFNRRSYFCWRVGIGVSWLRLDSRRLFLVSSTAAHSGQNVFRPTNTPQPGMPGSRLLPRW